MNFGVNDLELIIPVVAIGFGVFGIVMPAVVLGFARKGMSEHEQLAGPILFAATVICVTGLLVGAVTVLAVIGWLPPPNHWLHP